MAIFQRTIVCALVLLLAGCTVTLAPPYDKALVEGLQKGNTEVMTFFASVSDGTQAETFGQRKDAYARFIGHFDALALRAHTRVMPSDKKAVRKVNESIDIPKSRIPEDFKTPSATAMTHISEALTVMRNADQKQGLTATEVKGFKGNITIYLTQALVYERFLKR